MIKKKKRSKDARRDHAQIKIRRSSLRSFHDLSVHPNYEIPPRGIFVARLPAVIIMIMIIIEKSRSNCFISEK